MGAVLRRSAGRPPLRLTDRARPPSPLPPQNSTLVESRSPRRAHAFAYPPPIRLSCPGRRGPVPRRALVAQRTEHLTTDQEVAGSSPAERAGQRGVRSDTSSTCHVDVTRLAAVPIYSRAIGRSPLRRSSFDRGPARLRRPPSRLATRRPGLRNCRSLPLLWDHV